MKVICAWCGVSIERATRDEDGISMQRYIDNIPIPILLVDNDTGILAANLKASEMLGKANRNAIIDQLFGSVFDCAYARLPEGCGRTIHCSGCAIRRSVVATFNTGEPHFSVPATLTIESPDRLSEVVLTITTVKSNGLVVMRLDHVERPSSEIS